jgi:hypothetical protein
MQPWKTLTIAKDQEKPIPPCEHPNGELLIARVRGSDAELDVTIEGGAASPLTHPLLTEDHARVRANNGADPIQIRYRHLY